MRSVFYGTKGTIIADAKASYVQLFEDNEELGQHYADPNPQMVLVVPKDHNTTQEITDFLNALATDSPMPVKSYDGASTVAVCCAAVESCKTGMPVKIRYPKA